MATNLTTGLRYEETDVTSTSLATPPLYLLWEDNNDFRSITEGAETQPFTEEASYDNLLPQLDFSINFTDDLKGRFSYSKTIARAGYGQLAVAASGFGTTGSTLLGTQPRASASNPGLLPLESDNFDLSLEWYYDDASYASAGVFEKRVSNFIGTTQVMRTHFGIQDQTDGPRAIAARQTLIDEGLNINDTNLFVMMAVQEHSGQFSLADFETDGGGNVTPEFQQEVINYMVNETATGGLVPEAGDPLMEFLTSTPTNNREAKLYGAEFGVQHFFGDTGFGVQANYTIVRGDVGFDNLADPTENQFALTGLSDSANLIGIYEDYGWSVRVAYNWRDKFLTETNRGNGLNPTYVEEYGQIDMNVSYEVTDNINVFFEGLNLTGENIRHHGRSPNQIWYLEDLGARYNVGARYTF